MVSVNLSAFVVFTLLSVSSGAVVPDSLTPSLGKTFIEHCDDLQGVMRALGLRPTTLFSKLKKIETTLTKENNEYVSTSAVYLDVNGFERTIPVVTHFQLGQEVRKEMKHLGTVRYTVTREGNTFTKAWSRNGLHGTTVSTFTPEEVRTTIKTGGATYHCVSKPVCERGDFNCDNNV